MIAQKWQKIPCCCRECNRLRKVGKKYKCGASLMLPTSKKSCLKQSWRKKHVMDRLVEFMIGNGISSQFLDARWRYPSRHKKAKPWDFFVMAFDLHAIDKDEWVPWAYASTLWRIILEREYPEHVRGWESNLVSPKKKARGKYKEHIKSRFKRFLVENRCFNDWLKNMKRDVRYGHNKLTEPYSVLTNSFYWIATYEGHLYWQNLNKKWQEIIKTEYPEYLPKG